MEIVDFETKHIEEAELIAMCNYQEERERVPILPSLNEVPDLKEFADNNLGVAAFEQGKMVGFLCCYKPWDNAFNSKAIGTFSPIHGHGAVKENRDKIYKKMYEAAAKKWVEEKIAYHAIALYGHDVMTLNAMFTYGFGHRCVDGIRPMVGLEDDCSEAVNFEVLSKEQVKDIRELRRKLSQHFGNSPCFMYTSDEQFEKWLSKAEDRDTRLFVARDGKKPIAFLEISDSAENFITEVSSMKNICGAFCLPEYRGKNIFQGLLNYVILQLKSEGYKRLGVDYESINPTANSFWPKYFKSYTKSVVRRIDECAIYK